MPENLIDRAKRPFSLDEIRKTLSPGVPTIQHKHDFPEGFQIFAYDTLGRAQKNARNNDPATATEFIRLAGNAMPQQPFKWGGGQRVSKVYYPGNSEPTVHVLGAEETDVTIHGDLKDIDFAQGFEGQSALIRDNIDLIRYAGYICKFVLGDWVRWGYIQMTDWEMTRITRNKYAITLSIIGFEVPRHTRLSQRDNSIPFQQTERLRAEAQAIRTVTDGINLPAPDLAARLNNLVGQFAGGINVLTDYMDRIFQDIDNIRAAVNRGIGLIELTKQRGRSYATYLGSLSPFSLEPDNLPSRYALYSGISAGQTGFLAIMRIIESIQARMNELVDDLPGGQYIVKANDTLQSISAKVYGTADNWVKIATFNQLSLGQELPSGLRLDLPRED